MKISCLQENLSKGLGIVSHSIGKESGLPILSNVLLKTEEGCITLSATNLDIGVYARVRGKVDAEGAVALDAKVFSDFIALLPKEKIELSLDEHGIVSVRCGSYATKIRSANADDFPLLPSIERTAGLRCSSEGLKKAIQSTLFAVALEENRAELSGVLFEFDPVVLTLSLVATDAHRLSKCELSVKSDLSSPMKVILPSRTLQELLRILSNDIGGEVEMFLNENQVLFVCDSVELLSKIIHGSYPDYQQIIPQSFETETLVDVVEMAKAVKVSSIFSKTDHKDIHLSFSAKDNDKGEVCIRAENTTVGESETVLPIGMKGSENDVRLNHRYLLDGLSSLDDEIVFFGMIDKNNPCVIKPRERTDSLYLIMPLRDT